MKLPPTTQRVVLHSAEWKTERIEQEMARRLWYYADHPGEIGQRLRELDEEWDIERTLEANASTLTLVGLSLGVAVNRKWFLMPALVMGFLLQHALQGWCPPVPLFRRLGVRTQSEIDLEKYALKALRGDFGDLVSQVASPQGDRGMATRALDAVKR